MKRSKNPIAFAGSIAGLSFSLLFLLAAFAHPALAQSDQAASPDKTKTPVSKLSVSPTTLSYSVNLDKATTETKHFTIKNTGTATLDNLTVGTPSSPYYVITSGAVPSTIDPKGSATVDVEFIPHGPATDDGTIPITSGATSGKQDATVTLKGKATQKKPTPTATATATSTPTSTVTATPTVTLTPLPSTTPKASPSATATFTPTVPATATLTGSPHATPTGTPSATSTGATPTVTPSAISTGATPTATPSAVPGVEQYAPVLE